jgi:Phage late-transcription coactivator
MLINIELYQNLNQKIDEIVRAANTDYIDAILTYCNNNNLEIETVGEIIAKNQVLKSKVELEAEALHFIKPQERLPI